MTGILIIPKVNIDLDLDHLGNIEANDS